MSRVTSAIPFTAWLDEFQQAHREVRISSPWFSPGHSWQVTIPGRSMTSYAPGGDEMRADLEAWSQNHNSSDCTRPVSPAGRS